MAALRLLCSSTYSGTRGAVELTTPLPPSHQDESKQTRPEETFAPLTVIIHLADHPCGAERLFLQKDPVTIGAFGGRSLLTLGANFDIPGDEDE